MECPAPFRKYDAMNRFEKLANWLASKAYWVAGGAIVFMMLLTCADIILRLFRMPIPGTYELVCFMGAVAVAFAMAHTSNENGHVAVSLVIRLLPNRIQGAVEVITNFFVLILFILIAWRSVLYAESLRVTGEVSLTLKLPFYPFIYSIAFSAMIVCLVKIMDIYKSFLKVLNK
ncbi:MAG: TRAP transporter small permease [Deltaproteobacteria bacterium]|nr:TRAP transporter small permease [Deltaproteobacteria bacterium]